GVLGVFGLRRWREGSANLCLVGIVLLNASNADFFFQREAGYDMGGRRIRHQNHVGFVDCLPASDGRAVEHHAVDKHVFVDEADIHRNVLQLTLRIGEAKVDKLDVVVFDLFQNIVGSRHINSLFARRWIVRRYCQMASTPDSPVRIRITSSMLETKILPSPMRPVWAALRMASIALSTVSSATMTSTFTLGRKSTTYCAPR